MDKLKTVLLCTCFVIGLLPSFGQTPDGSPQVIFRFVEGKDMFYVPWNGNGASLALRANLLRWATLSPDLGIEWRISPNEYVVIDNVRVRSGEGSKNWWGPVHAGVTLVWTLF